MRAVVLDRHAASPPVPVPLALCRVRAGFPLPADDGYTGALDLSVYVGADPSSTFYVRAEGDSMVGDGIFDGDLLVVDRAVEPRHGDVVIAAVDGELTVKRFVRRGRRAALLAAKAGFPPIVLREGQDLVVWGVVTHSVRQHRRHRDAAWTNRDRRRAS